MEMPIASKTIAAISTPMAVGGISVIRISGEDAFKVADRVFFAKNEKSLSLKKGYTASFGQIKKADGTVLDDVVALVFKAPHSYTGENVVEFSCHGGVYSTKEILSLILSNGAALAEPGEFTKRAFLNGKLSLTQAEAVSDMIYAKNAQALRAANAQLSGSLFKRVERIKEILLNSAAHLNVWADYPEEDVEELDLVSMQSDIKRAKEDLGKLLATFDQGKIIREGVPAAIVGKPNVGKSTIMNLLSGEEKSIVTSIEGTTRDIVEEAINVNGITLLLSDTAGIRETENEVEKEGVKRALKKIESADLIIAVFDASRELTYEDKEIIEAVKGKNAVAVINKTDILQFNFYDEIKENFDDIIKLSAKDEESRDKLFEAISKKISVVELDLDTGILANERQRQCALSCYDILSQIIDAISLGVTPDAITVLVESAIENLMSLSGLSVTQEVVDRVFSNFCVGK